MIWMLAVRKQYGEARSEMKRRVGDNHDIVESEKTPGRQEITAQPSCVSVQRGSRPRERGAAEEAGVDKNECRLAKKTPLEPDKVDHHHLIGLIWGGRHPGGTLFDLRPNTYKSNVRRVVIKRVATAAFTSSLSSPPYSSGSQVSKRCVRELLSPGLHSD